MYLVKGRRADGKSEVTIVDGDKRTTYVTERPVEMNCFGRGRKPPKRVMYNFNNQITGEPNSRQLRVRHIKDGLDRLRSEYTSTKGFSKGKTMQHVASIPPELYWKAKIENGPEWGHDSKDLEKLVSEHDLGVV